MDEKKEQKFVYKRWWFWIILLLISIILIFLLISFNNKQNVGAAGISKKEFERIELGMSEFEVLSIIDSEGLLSDDNIYDKVISENSKSNENHIYKYSRKILGETTGYAIITYTADYSNGDLFVTPTVSSKEEYNLK